MMIIMVKNVNIKLLECAIPAALSLQRSQSARSYMQYRADIGIWGLRVNSYVFDVFDILVSFFRTTYFSLLWRRLSTRCKRGAFKPRFAHTCIEALSSQISCKAFLQNHILQIKMIGCWWCWWDYLGWLWPLAWSWFSEWWLQEFPINTLVIICQYLYDGDEDPPWP